MSDQRQDKPIQIKEKKMRKGSSKPQTSIYEYESKIPPQAEEGETGDEGGDFSRKSSLDVRRKSLTTDVIAGNNIGLRKIVNEDEEPSNYSYVDSLTTVKIPVIKSDAQLLKELDDAKLLELKEAFILFDLDGDGFIDHKDLKGTLISLGQDVTDEEIRLMLSEVRGPMDFDAFVTLLGYKTIELDSEETLIEALSKWDYDQSGLISEERIRHDLMTWGDRFSLKEVDWAFEEAPTTLKKGNVMIDYIKFCKTLCGLRKRQK